MPKRRKFLGQCFLEDKNILALEAKLLDPKDKTVLEIGGGDGRLTRAILQQKPKKLFVVEKDPRFAAMLRDISNSAIQVLEGDFLTIQIPEIDLIIGNIPYYISSEIIFSLPKLHFEKALLMVQKEFAQKMVAKPGDSNYGRLSVTAQIHFEITLEHIVPNHLFRPVPKVDSAIIMLKPTRTLLSGFEEDIIRFIFQHKNKNVKNALIHSNFSASTISKLGGLALRRGRTLAKEECLEIARILETNPA